MTDIARLTVALYANSAQFVSELQKTNKKAADWKKQMASAFSSVAAIGAAAAAGAAASLTLIYKEQSALIDQTAKFADRIGISTEALSQLRYASELTGVGTKSLDMSLQRMTRRVQEAAQGSGEAKDAIKQLGLNAQELGKMTPDQQLYSLADAFSEVDDQSERVRLSFKLFDSEGVGMVNLLAGGADGLAEMAAEADALGVTLDRVSAAKIEMANDAMFRINAMTTAVKQNIAIELAPVVKALADDFVDMAKQHGGLSNIIIEGTYSIAKGASYAGDAYRGWELLLKSVSIAWQQLKIAGMEAINSLTGAATGFKDSIYNNIAKPLRATAEALAPYSDMAAGIVEDLRSLENYKTKPLFTLEEVYPERVELKRQVEELRALMSEPLPSESIDKWYEETRDRIDKLAEEYTKKINRNDGTGTATSGDSGKSDDKEAKEKEKENQRLRDEIEQMRLSFLTQDQLEYEHWEQRQQTLNEWFQQEYAIAEGNKQLMASLDDQYLQLSQDSHKEYSDNIDQLEKDRVDNQRQAYSDLFSDLTGLTKTFAGEQSGIYKVMFAAQKAYSIANSIVAIQTAIAQAAASTTFPANFVAMASVASATAGLVSTIQGTTYHTGGIAGQASDNYSQKLAAGEVPAILMRGEEVLPATDPRHRNNLQTSSNNGGFVWSGNIIINNNGEPVSATASMDNDGNITVLLQRMDEYLANNTYNGTGQLTQANEAVYGMNRAAGLMR